jgi:NADH-quinone oxidoreductase subunit F
MKQATTKRLTSIADLEVWRQALVAAVDAHRRRIRVCDGTGCRALGSRQVIANLQEELDRVGLAAEVDVVATGCPGFCEQGPLLTIDPAGIAYNHVQIDDAAQIVNETIVGGQILDRLIYVEPESGQAIVQEQRLPFYARQVRRVLELNGQIDPTKIEDYIAAGGYSALSIALQRLTPQDVIEEVKGSGLRGRGGAGFSTGVKWQLCRNAPGEIKYLICNADEGDPGAFMDRSILEGNPHSVLEGMLIGAYAMGASQGYIYIRAEYPLAIKHLQIALEQMHALGLLGKNILGSGLDFDVELRIGAGAFVCGEETALMASIEGRTGEPRQRPPFPAQSGLWGKPTNINNVKSWANVALIIAKGADWFAEVGTESGKGTVIFSVVGKIRNTGLVEVPIGVSLHKLIFSIGGGVPDGKAFKAAQIGGPSGGCIPAAHLDTPIDYESLGKLGAIMGSGGLVVADEDTCMVDLARYFMSFTQEESCGKCVPCRVGTKAMLATLERICAGQGRPGDIEYLEELAQEIKASSLCGLGQTAPNPVLTTIRYFRDEYEAHILEQRCPARVCTALVRAPCVSACPAGVDVPAYLSLVAQGRHAEALAVHRDANPFASICGRVCPAFCEEVCKRGGVDESIAIRHVKRFMADHEYEMPWTPPRLAPPKGKQVAVIGAGPCGLTAALRLAQQGYGVTVFERMPEPGGMMTYGIPAYRLPREPLFAEIDNIRRAGVEIRCGVELGSDFTVKSLQAEGYAAIVLALGAHQSRRLDVEGEDLPGVYHGVQMLRDIALGKLPDLTDKVVVVVGGGDTAMDAARSAWRLGAKEVHIVYRRERDQMPAIKEEIRGAEEEGVQLHLLQTPVAVLGHHGHVTGVRLQRQELGDFDKSGRRRPVAMPGSEFDMPCDVLVPAIGQVTWVDDETVGLYRSASFKVGKAFELGAPGVFAAGDAVTGPATVVQAVAHGNQVALVVDHWLQTGELGGVYYHPQRHDIPQLFNLDDYAEARRPGPQMLSPDERHSLHGFHEVELAYDERTIQEECKRCLRCDLDWLQHMGLEPIGLEAEEKQPGKSEVRWLARQPVPEAPLAVERSYA